MHEAASDDRVERIDRRRVACARSGRSPERRNVGADAHAIHDAYSLAKRAAASEDECVVAGAGANRLETMAQSFTARQSRIVTASGRRSRVQEIELQI